MRPVLVGAFTTIVLLAAGGFFFLYSEFTRPGPLDRDQVLVIEKGAGSAAIAGQLGEAGIIRYPWAFRIATRFTGQDRMLRAGEYQFPAGSSAQEVAGVLIAGVTLKRRLTIAEGITTREVLQLVSEADGLNGSLTLAPGEGRLLPETYFYSYGDSRDALVERMQIALEETLAELWAKRAADLPFKTPVEALVLASIVERETAVPAERRRVAAVFINRLRRGMRLQADPTVVYGLTQGKGPLARSLTRADLKVQTPYNTYLIDGLPPGPIANPGREAIAAVLDPLDTKELYFVANGNGGHAFAETLDEHNRNVARWRKLKRQKRRATTTH
ncbi:MAG: endolytic transglycosylase MltG [Alphaproteobacteria bacterium]|nr:endolytic transglycosylase MltG [Alphaproteobacteria bacterium]